MAGDVIPAERMFALYSPVERIKKHVAAFYGVKPTDLSGRRRQREFTHPRQVAMYLCREFSPQSFPRIGQQFGGRDHTTVLHAMRAVDDRMAADPLLRRQVDALRAAISEDIGTLVENEEVFLVEAIANRTRDTIKSGLRRLLEMDDAAFSEALLPVVLRAAAERRDDEESPIREVV